MPNGERIQFGTHVNFIFETSNLRFASPATINRLSVMSLSEENVDVNHNSWLVRNVLGHMVPGQKKDVGKDEEFVIAKTDFSFLLCAEA